MRRGRARRAAGGAGAANGADEGRLAAVGSAAGAAGAARAAEFASSNGAAGSSIDATSLPSLPVDLPLLPVDPLACSWWVRQMSGNTEMPASQAATGNRDRLALLQGRATAAALDTLNRQNAYLIVLHGLTVEHNEQARQPPLSHHPSSHPPP